MQPQDKKTMQPLLAEKIPQSPGTKNHKTFWEIKKINQPLGTPKKSINLLTEKKNDATSGGNKKSCNHLKQTKITHLGTIKNM
jgi:hypothetical protein